MTKSRLSTYKNINRVIVKSPKIHSNKFVAILHHGKRGPLTSNNSYVIVCLLACFLQSYKNIVNALLRKAIYSYKIF